MKYITKIASAKLPTTYGKFKIMIYKQVCDPSDLKSIKDGFEHVVLFKGKSEGKSTLVRIHSQCLTGDVFSSLKCDCREQLVKALTKIGKAKKGVLIYLNQEGRGIGLVNKIKAYSLQEKGLDTVEANKRLGLAADLRDYQIAAEILKDLNISKITLMTNNPDKVKQLTYFGITVTACIPLEVPPNRLNKSYLKTKKDKLGHKLRLVEYV